MYIYLYLQKVKRADSWAESDKRAYTVIYNKRKTDYTETLDSLILINKELESELTLDYISPKTFNFMNRVLDNYLFRDN